jgi:ectoine hydroxylase-related dioxygenase (phytanoyl-CoA dioxygenase family)
LGVNKNGYPMKMKPAHYFCLVGRAVALRPGDMLLFNPQYYHCCSQKTLHYKANNVYVNTN